MVIYYLNLKGKVANCQLLTAGWKSKLTSNDLGFKYSKKEYTSHLSNILLNIVLQHSTIYKSNIMIPNLVQFLCHPCAIIVYPCAAIVQLLCHHSAIILPSSCQHSAIILPSFCHHSAIILPSFCHHFAIILPSYCHHSAIILPSFCHCSAILVSSIWHY